jgi:glycine/serine hydroxymethyltransferase
MNNEYRATDTVTGTTSKAKRFASPKGAAIAFENEGRVFFKFYKNTEAALNHIDKVGPVNEPGSVRIASIEIIK